jgi:hypothetical protein
MTGVPILMWVPWPFNVKDRVALKEEVKNRVVRALQWAMQKSAYHTVTRGPIRPDHAFLMTGLIPVRFNFNRVSALLFAKSDVFTGYLRFQSSGWNIKVRSLCRMPHASS